jgi:hypothetical protein
MTMVRAAIVGVALLRAAMAGAQTTASDGPVFLDLHVGLAGRPGSLSASSSFSLFGETGSATTLVQPGNSSMLDVRVGVRAGRRFGAALAASGGRGESAAKATASVPSPIRFASPSIVTLDAPGLKRREVGYLVQAVWFLPVGDRLNLSLFGGPSLIHLQQGVPVVSIGNAAQATSISVTNESGNALGGNVGVDLTSFVTSRIGAGLFVRYVAGRVNLPSAADAQVGGFQGGAGLRLRF